MKKECKKESVSVVKASTKKAKKVEFDLFNEKTWKESINIDDLITNKVIDEIRRYEDKINNLRNRVTFFAERKDVKHALLLKRKYPESFAAMQIKIPMTPGFTKAVQITEAVSKLETFIDSGTVLNYKEMIPLLKLVSPFFGEKNSEHIDRLRAMSLEKITGNAAWDIYISKVSCEDADEDELDDSCVICGECDCEGECEDDDEEADPYCEDCHHLDSECLCEDA